MRRSRPVSILAFVLLALFGTAQLASAQGSIAPNRQFGIGVNTSGFQVQYALSPGMHLGATFSLRTGKVTDEDTGLEASSTVFGLGPYFRALLEGTVNPFLQAGLNVVDAGGGSDLALYAGFGLEYFINRNVGVWAGATVLELGFDPSQFNFGFFAPAAGLEWYFNP